jgi:hypothetical protein
MVPFKKVPFSEITEEFEIAKIGDLHSVSVSEMNDTEFARLFRQLESSCDDKCKNLLCQHYFSKTTATASLDARYNLSTRIRVQSPETPTMDVHSLANFTALQLAIYVLSCVGIWFGFSVLSFDPNNLKVVFNQLKKWKRPGLVFPLELSPSVGK